MRRLAVLVTSLLGLAVPAAYACYCGGCPPSSCGTSNTAIPGSGLLFVHPSGQRGPLAAYGSQDGRERFSLPAGILSANGSRFLAARRTHARTTYRLYDARNGRPLQTWARPGRAEIAGLSANGRVAALLHWSRRATRIELVSAAHGVSIDSVTLRGSFDVDAVSNDGRRLFLVEWLRSGGYLIRGYDVAQRRLLARPLTEDGETMDGTAWDSVASRDGHRVLTLYLRANGDVEVHTLELVRQKAVCIDLPRGAVPAEWQYGLALTRNGRTLFATNPALGIVARIDLRTRRVVRLVRFTRDRDAINYASSVAAVSRDGAALAFSAGDELYVYDVAHARVRGPYPAGDRITGLAFGARGARLLALRASGAPLLLDARSGKPAR
jgi:hypothetical protein